MSAKTVCPRCKAENHCGAASDPELTEHCWCFNFAFSPALKAKLALEYPEKDSCLCRDCIEALAAEVEKARQS